MTPIAADKSTRRAREFLTRCNNRGPHRISGTTAVGPSVAEAALAPAHRKARADARRLTGA
jgi:hypothetical protein